MNNEVQAQVDQRYISSTEVVMIAGISEGMIRNLESKGRFPKRIKMSSRSSRWWMPTVLEWKKDPEAWAQNQQTANQSVA